MKPPVLTYAVSAVAAVFVFGAEGLITVQPETDSGQGGRR